jgi:hypothetical protein
MTPYWDEIKEFIEQAESEKLARSLSNKEQQDGYFRKQPTLTEKNSRYLGVLGGISMGILVGIFTLIFNYIFFVFFLHLNF